MAIWLVIRKAVKIWCAVRTLKRAKTNAYRVSKGLKPIFTWWQIIWHWFKRLFKFVFLYLLCWFCVIKWKKSWKYSLWNSLWISGTLANEILKSLAGLICGMICTHLAFIFVVFVLNISSVLPITITLLVGSVFTFGLAFTQFTRCFAFLALPPLLFSKEGRVALLGFILVLALSGPAKNTSHNMEVLTESLVCSQEMANNATGGLLSLVKSPTSFLRKSMGVVIDQIKETSNKIIAALTILVNIIRSIVDVIIKAIKWLKSIVESCNSDVGGPYERCSVAIQAGIDDCNYHLPYGLKWLCSVAEFAQYFCHLAKLPQAMFCWLPKLVKEHIFLPIKDFSSNFMVKIKEFFKIGFKFNYTLEHDISSSKSFKEIVHDMKTEVMDEISWLLHYVDWIDFFVSLFFLYGFAKALVYRYRFLHSDRYDNSYITKGLVKFDWERKLRGREHIFPLKYREAVLYVDSYSFKLLEHERKILKYSMAIVLISAAKILSYLLLDVLLYAFLELLRKHGAIRIETQQQLGFSTKILGTGFLADMYRGILRALTPVGQNLPAFDTTPCLPIAHEPDYLRYLVICSLLLFVFFATLLEPFGLRSRHMICSIYYPDRIIPRDRWLYFHILNSRGNFFTFAKNQLLARVTRDKVLYRFSFIDRLSHTVPCFHRIVIWMGWEKKACFLCGKKGDKDDLENFYHCPSCHSVFCLDCFQELENECPLCTTTIRFDAIDEELGSESSDPESKSKKKGIERIKLKKLKKRKDSTPNVKYNELHSSSSEDENSGNRPRNSKRNESGSGLSSLDDITTQLPSTTGNETQMSNHKGLIELNTFSESTKTNAKAAEAKNMVNKYGESDFDLNETEETGESASSEEENEYDESVLLLNGPRKLSILKPTSTKSLPTLPLKESKISAPITVENESRSNSDAKHSDSSSSTSTTDSYLSEDSVAQDNNLLKLDKRHHVQPKQPELPPLASRSNPQSNYSNLTEDSSQSTHKKIMTSGNKYYEGETSQRIHNTFKMPQNRTDSKKNVNADLRETKPKLIVSDKSDVTVSSSSSSESEETVKDITRVQKSFITEQKPSIVRSPSSTSGTTSSDSTSTNPQQQKYFMKPPATPATNVRKLSAVKSPSILKQPSNKKSSGNVRNVEKFREISSKYKTQFSTDATGERNQRDSLSSLKDTGIVERRVRLYDEGSLYSSSGGEDKSSFDSKDSKYAVSKNEHQTRNSQIRRTSNDNNSNILTHETAGDHQRDEIFSIPAKPIRSSSSGPEYLPKSIFEEKNEKYYNRANRDSVSTRSTSRKVSFPITEEIPHEKTQRTPTENCSSDEEIDEDGLCHHHQHVDPEIYDKYSEVVTELESLAGDEGQVANSTSDGHDDSSTEEQSSS